MHQPPSALSWAPNGAVTFDAMRALELANKETREWHAAMEDLARLGMETEGPSNVKTPRAKVGPPTQLADIHTPIAEPGQHYWQRYMQPGMGDILTSVQEPGQHYWDRLQQPRAVPDPYRPVAAKEALAETLPPDARKYWPIVEQAFGPLLSKTLERFQKCGPWYTQPLAWLAPPVTAICVDVFTDANGVALPGAYPGIGDCIDVLLINVPDRWVFVLDRFGNELEKNTTWGDVRFSMQRNATPLRCYGNFDVQLGRFVNPTKFGSPIILKHKDAFRLKAQSLSAVQHTAFARVMGWAFAARTITADGSQNEFCVQ